MRRVKESEEIRKIRAERIKTQTEIIKNIVYILTAIGTLIKVWWSF